MDVKDTRSSYPLRVDPKLLEKARFIASTEGRSLNKQIERLLMRMVGSYEAKHGEIEVSVDDDSDKK